MMKKWMTKLCAALFFFGSLEAYIPNATFNFDLGLGYRRDRLSLADVKWDNLHSFELKGTFTAVACNYLYMRAYGDYGWVLSGKRDHFDFGDHKVESGNVLDYSVGFGWHFPFCDEQLFISPLLGYSHHEQNLPLRKSNSHDYHAEWEGPWGGVDLSYYLTCDWFLFGSYEYHWNNQFHGKGHLKHQREHLAHRGHGYGTITTIGTSYGFGYEWLVGVSADYQTFRTKHEQHHRHHNHSAKWQSFDVLAHLDYRY